jgi:hypothetical protein
VVDIVASVLDAINARDERAFVACFVSDGAIVDGDDRFAGARQLRLWFDTEVRRPNAVVSMLARSRSDDVDVLTWEWDCRSFHDERVQFCTLALVSTRRDLVASIEFRAARSWPSDPLRPRPLDGWLEDPL